MTITIFLLSPYFSGSDIYSFLTFIRVILYSIKATYNVLFISTVLLSTHLCPQPHPASWEETCPRSTAHISLPGLCSGVPEGPLMSTRPLPLLPGRQTGMGTLSDQRKQGKGETREAGKEQERKRRGRRSMQRKQAKEEKG